jgi:beta-glucanase (GH16 family)
MRGSVVLFVLIGAFLAVTVAGAVPQSGGSTQTTITVAGLDCGTDYRVRINRVGQSSNATVIRIATSACNGPTPPPEPPPAAGCPPSDAPGPIAGQGYSQVWGDCFNVLDRATWCPREWWEPNPPAGSQFVANGELHLQRTRANSFRNTTVSTGWCGQAYPKRFKFGYFEARMKFDTVRGNGPAFWMTSSRHQLHAMSPDCNFPAYPDCQTDTPWNENVPNPYCQRNGLPLAECYGSELDVFEGYGDIQYGGSRMDDWWSGTLHRNTSSFYGVPNTTRGLNDGTGLELEQYHTYSARWTPNQVCYFLDNVQKGCLNTFDSTNQPMYLLLYNWNTVWESENMPNSTTPNVLDVAVDWVRVWQ